MSKIRKIDVWGGFHNVMQPVTVYAKIDEKRGAIIISPHQLEKISSYMCNYSGCICGMSHGWQIEGATMAELSEAMQDAAVAAERSRNRYWR
jgi:hypothetical protein